MNRICPDCQHTMEKNCVLESTYRINIVKKRPGLFTNTSSKLKAAVCTNCGHVTLYVDNYEEYKD